MSLPCLLHTAPLYYSISLCHIVEASIAECHLFADRREGAISSSGYRKCCTCIDLSITMAFVAESVPLRGD